MSASNIKVFVPSIQHTGTWFTINNISKFIPSVKIKEATFLLENLEKAGQHTAAYEYKYDDPLVSPTIIQIHFPIDVPECKLQHSRFFKDWHSNLGSMRCLPVQTILLYCNLFKTVIPVRDPIAAILTRETRHPQFDHFYIVDGFIDLCKEFMQHPNVKFFPIDLYLENNARNIAARRKLFQEVLTHCGIPLNSILIDEVARNWMPENITPNNKLKQLYDSGNLAQLKFEMGHKWSSITYARQMYGAYANLMESLGYTGTTMFKGRDWNV